MGLANAIRKMIDDIKKLYESDKSSLDPSALISKWLGSNGVLKSYLAQLRNMPGEEKKRLGQIINEIKEELNDLKLQTTRQRETNRLKVAPRDLTYSFGQLEPGFDHPVSAFHSHLARFYLAYGFSVVDGPEIETQFNNFDALNIQEHHPARDMQDTFYVEPVNVSLGELQETRDVLRTHTTAIQARVLSTARIPIKVVCFGKVYRNETEDASHQAMFHQFELLWVDRNIGLPELLSLIEESLLFLFGDNTKIRFVPKYYPYTQPSIGVQIACALCEGVGCSFCGGSGYSTVGGAGVVHPSVLERFNFDPKEITGLAFGLGSSRIAAQKAGIPKLRSLYDGDLRFLRRF